MSSGGPDLDMAYRDCNDLNGHVSVCFEDVIGEPEGAHSIGCVWLCSYKCFNCWKSCCYKLLTIFCAIPLAMCWGCEFAYITFFHVWTITPCMRAYMIQCGCMQKFYGTCLQCYLQPCFEAMSLILNNIKVTNVSG